VMKEVVYKGFIEVRPWCERGYYYGVWCGIIFAYGQ